MLLTVRKDWPFFKTLSRGNGIKETVEWGEEEIYLKKKSPGKSKINSMV